MRAVAFGVAFCALVLGLAACLGPRSADADARFLNTAAGVDYVGDATCATCHQDLYESYQSHGMAQSFYPMTEEVAVEAFPGVEIRDATSGFVYRARREGDLFVQEEYREEPDGSRSHELVRTMDYVVGSGSAARTYLTEENGRLYELPLTWYTQSASDPEQGTTVGPASGGGHWEFSPGYAEANGRFSRTIPERCMACHNGTSEAVPFADGAYASLAQGIGCEQCHGPGELHVEARLAGTEAPDSVDVTIVNPAHLTLDLQLDVCQQCHLNGDVSVLRDGETAESYRPGRPLSAHRAIFATAANDPNTVSVISHADRMKQSECFTESKALTCVTCHDPHEGFRDKGPDYFNATCRSCHATDALQTAMPSPELRQQHTVAGDCFSCHMPKVTAEDAPHASFTDHWTRVVGRDEITGTGSGNDLESYYPEDEGSVYEAMAYVVWGRTGGGGNALRRGVAALADLDRTTEMGEADYLLGFARLQMGQAAQAIEPLEAALASQRNPERLNTLAQAYEQTGRPAFETERLYREAIGIQPRAASIRVNLGRLLESQGRLDVAISTYRQAIDEEPWLAQAHVLLGGALAKSGDLGGATTALREAIRLQPDQPDALTNLGVLVAQQGDIGQAGRLFQRAVTAGPQNADALANLALFQINNGQLQQAQANAQAALRVNPAQGTAQQVLRALSGG